MKLYHCRNARSLRCLWALEEMELDYELVNMRSPPRSEHPGYLDINPLGTVPAFIDRNVLMTESSGICHYLADRYGAAELAVGVEDPEYGEYLNWLYRSDATLTFPQTLVLRYSALEPQERRLPQIVDDYTIWYHSRLRCVETGLEGKRFLVADRFTIADITVCYALFFGTLLGLDDRYKPNCRRYLGDMTARPAFQRALMKQQE